MFVEAPAVQTVIVNLIMFVIRVIVEIHLVQIVPTVYVRAKLTFVEAPVVQIPTVNQIFSVIMVSVEIPHAQMKQIVFVSKAQYPQILQFQPM